MTDQPLIDVADAAVADAPAAPDAGPQDSGWTTVTDPKEAAAASAAAAKAGSGQLVTLAGADFLASKDPGYAAVIKAISEGRRQAPTGMALRTPYGQRLAQDVYQYDPTADDVNLPARAATRKAFTSGKQGQNIASFNTALGHLGTLAKASEALDNGDFPLINSIANSWGPALGNTSLAGRVRDYGVARTALTEEMVRAFKQAGGNVHEVEQWEQQLNSADSPTAMRHAMATGAKLLQSRIDAQRDSYNVGMGTSNQDLPTLNAHARAAMAAFQSQDYLDKGYNAIGVPIDGTTPKDDENGNPPLPGLLGGGAPPSVGGGGTPPAPPAPTSPAGDPPPADAPKLSEDGSSDFVSSRSKQFAGEATALLNTGKASRADFDALATKYGYQNGFAGTGADIGQLDNVIAYANKGGKGAMVAPPVQHTDPTIVGRIANSAIGSAAIGLADTGSFGLAPKAIGAIQAVQDRLSADNRSFGDIYANDLSDAHAAIGASEAAHPLAALGGQVGGFITGGAALGAGIRAIPGAAGLVSRVPGAVAPLADDVLQGAAYGAGSQDHLADVPGAALKGGALAAAGGVLGRGVARGIAAVASPVANAAVQRLTNAGVTLTPGQILGAGGSLFGRAVKGVEDRVAGFSGVGDIVNATRRGGVEDFNRAAINDALAPIGQKASGIGHDGIADMQLKASDAIGKALKPINAAPDVTLQADIASATKAAGNLSKDYRGQFASAIETDVKPYLTGQTITGDSIKAVKEGLDARIGNLRGQGSTPQDRDLADALDNVKESFLDFADRADPSAASDYKVARQAYAMSKRVEAAAAKAKDGVFTPNQFRQAVTKRGYGTTTANVANGSAPMQQLATDASTILPNTVPDSGTAGRAALGLAAARLSGGAALGGAAGYEQGGGTGALAGAALGATLLSRPGAKAIQYGLAGSREKTLNTLGSFLRRNADIGGAIGAPALLAHRGN